MSGITAVAPSAIHVEEVTAHIIPARGVSVADALRDAKIDGVQDVTIRQKERDALVSIFKRKPLRPVIEFVDNVLWFRVRVPKGADTLAFNLDKGVVIGLIATIAVWDIDNGCEWARSFFAPPADLSMGGVLTFNREKQQ